MNKVWHEAFKGLEVVRYKTYDSGACYEGWGSAIAELKDGSYAWGDYSHCSCNDAIESLTTGGASNEYHALHSVSNRTELEKEDWVNV